jgi:hypothetical protein
LLIWKEKHILDMFTFFFPMRISLSPRINIPSSQATILARLVSDGCILHEEYADLPEKEHALIEVLPQGILTNFIGKDNIPQKVEIQIQMSAYDIEKMLHLKQRIQRIKDLITRYSTLNIDRAACAQSPIKQQAYSINVTCQFSTDKATRQLQRPASTSPLEKMYISLYQVLSAICGWWTKVMMSTVIANREAVKVSFDPVSSKKSALV